MVSIRLIVVVERLALLRTIRGQQHGIKVKQTVFRFVDRVGPLSEDLLDFFQLLQALFVHAIVKSRQGRLRGQRGFSYNRGHHRIIS